MSKAVDVAFFVLRRYKELTEKEIRTMLDSLYMSGYRSGLKSKKRADTKQEVLALGETE